MEDHSRSADGRTKSEQKTVDAIHKKHGFVYVVRMSGTNFYKVGHTFGKVEDQITSLQTGCPAKIVFVSKAWVSRPEHWENKIHKAIKDYHTMGEWFDLPPWRLAKVVAGMQALKQKYVMECEDMKELNRKSAAMRQRARDQFWKKHHCAWR